jgi:hypothetical protein
MASILKVDDLRGNTAAGNITITSEGGSATMQLQQGLAKMWVNMNGQGTIATRDSLNVSGVTDNGTGNYTYALSLSMSNADYANTAMANEGNAGDVMIDDNNAVPTTSAIRVQARSYSGGTVQDPDFLYHTAFGDLA